MFQSWLIGHVYKVALLTGYIIRYFISNKSPKLHSIVAFPWLRYELTLCCSLLPESHPFTHVSVESSLFTLWGPRFWLWVFLCKFLLRFFFHTFSCQCKKAYYFFSSFSSFRILNHWIWLANPTHSSGSDFPISISLSMDCSKISTFGNFPSFLLHHKTM